MIVNETFHGWEMRLKPRGWGRFLAAGFLCFWLCGWVAGEIFAGWVLIRGAAKVSSSELVFASQSSGFSGAAVLFVGLFLLLWLGLWTWGGITAIRELLGLIWGEDRLLVRPDALSIERHRGPFVTKTVFRRDELEQIGRKDRSTIIIAHCRANPKPVTVTAYARETEVEELLASLRQKLGLMQPKGESIEGRLAAGWIERRAEDGKSVLLKDPAIRSRQGWILSLLAVVLSLPAVSLLIQSVDTPKLVAALISGGLAILCGWGARHLFTTHEEWSLGSKQIQRRWITPSGVRDGQTGRLLVVVRDNDSDGDPWYRLEVWLPEANALTRKGRLALVVTSGDRWEPLRMGRWIEQRTGIIFEDRSTPEAESAQLAQWKDQLAKTGRFGQWVAKRLPDRPPD